MALDITTGILVEGDVGGNLTIEEEAGVVVTEA